MGMMSRYVFGSTNITDLKRDVMDKKHQLFRGASELWKELSIPDMERYLNQCEGQLHQFVRVINGNEDLAIPTTARFSQETQKSFLDRSYISGATIKIEDYESRHPLVSKICRDLEIAFGGNVYAMTFLTPAGQHGFPVHFDVAGAVIIQLDGSKHWKIYDRVVDSPTHALNHRLREEDLAAPIDEFVMRNGDVLYIPSGFPHSAICTDEHSLHLSIGLNTWKPYQLLNFLVSCLAEAAPELRTSIYSKDDDSVMKLTGALDVLRSQLATINPMQLIDKFETSFNANRSEPDSQAMSNYSASLKLSGSSLVSRNRWKLVKQTSNDGKIRLFPSSTIRPGKSLLPTSAFIEIPAHAGDEIDFLLNSVEPVAIADIPGQLDVQSKIILATMLTRHGILSIAKP